MNKLHAFGIGLALVFTVSFSGSVSEATNAEDSFTKLNEVSRFGSNILICKSQAKRKFGKSKKLTKMHTAFNSIAAWVIEADVYIPSRVRLTVPAQQKVQRRWGGVFGGDFECGCCCY